MSTGAVSLWLDTRKPKKKEESKFLFKRQVFCSHPRNRKRYPAFYFSIEEFASINETAKPRKEHKDTKDALKALYLRAKKVVKEFKTFSFEAFEAATFGALNKNAADVLNLLDTVIEQKQSIGSVSTAETYPLAKTCTNKYLKHQKRKDESEKEFEPLTFDEITIEFINKLKRYCEKRKTL